MNWPEENPKRPDENPGVPLWKLERYMLGELPASEMERIGGLRESDPAVATWIEALEAEYSDLKNMHPTGRMAGRIWNRLCGPSGRGGEPGDSGYRRRTSWKEPRLWMPALGMALVLSLLPFNIASWIESPSRPGEGVEETRLKGIQPGLFLYRKTGEAAQILKSGDRARAGDLIQIFYDAAGREYGAIFSLDREGKVTWHLPDGGNMAAPLATGRRVPLEFAFELDTTPGFERFFFVASDRPFPIDSAVAGWLAGSETAGAAGPERLDLPERFFQFSLALIKEPGT